MIVITCLHLLSVTAVLASECDALLIPDISFTKVDISTDLSYLSVISSSNFESHKKKAKAGLSLPIAEGLLEASANYKEFAERRRSEYAKHKWNYSHQDLSIYYKSRLPDHLAKRFNECKNMRGIQILVVRADSEYVEVKVGWVPFPKGPTSVEFNEPFVSGGRIVGNIPSSLAYSEERTLNFARIAGKTFRFNANAGGSTASIIVPRFITASPIKKLTLGSCRGQGGANGVQLWGPPGKPCGGMKKPNGKHTWGSYGDQLTISTEVICDCVARGDGNGIKIWGPKGKNCGGMSDPAWGQYGNVPNLNMRCFAVGDIKIGHCVALGGWNGIKMWGPVGELCGGMADKRWKPYK